MKKDPKRNRRPTLLAWLVAALIAPGSWYAASAWQQNQTQGQNPAVQQDRQQNQQNQAGQQNQQGQQGQQNRNQQQGGQQQPVLVSVSIPVYATTAGAIAASPQAFYGNLVSVQAEIEDVQSPHLFTLDEDRIGAGPDVLVLAPRPAARMPEDEVVTVIGHVRPLSQAEMDRDYDWFDPSWLTRLGGQRDTRPIIIAASIIDRNGRQLLREPVQGSQ